MSAPDTNALPPAPVTTTTRTSSSPAKLLQDAGRRLPHLQRHRVVPLGIVEGHDADAALFAGEHLGCRGHRYSAREMSIEARFGRGQGLTTKGSARPASAKRALAVFGRARQQLGEAAARCGRAWPSSPAARLRRRDRTRWRGCRAAAAPRPPTRGCPPPSRSRAAATPSVRHGVPVGALLGLAEAVLALDLDVMEAPGQVEAIDLGALQLGRAVGDEGEQHPLPAQRIDDLVGVGVEGYLLLAGGREAIGQAPRDLARGYLVAVLGKVARTRPRRSRRRASNSCSRPSRCRSGSDQNSRADAADRLDDRRSAQAAQLGGELLGHGEPGTSGRM